MGKNGRKIITPVPPQPDILLSGEHFTYVNEMSARTGIPGSTVLRMLLDLAIHRLQFMGIESVLSPSALKMAYGIGKAPAPPPPEAPPEEPSQFSATERLRRQQIAAGLIPAPECPACRKAELDNGTELPVPKTEMLDPATLVLKCRACGWEG